MLLIYDALGEREVGYRLAARFGNLGSKNGPSQAQHIS